MQIHIFGFLVKNSDKVQYTCALLVKKKFHLVQYSFFSSLSSRLNEWWKDAISEKENEVGIPLYYYVCVSILIFVKKGAKGIEFSTVQREINFDVNEGIL